jgi:hypothetical protein
LHVGRWNLTLFQAGPQVKVLRKRGSAIIRSKEMRRGCISEAGKPPAPIMPVQFCAVSLAFRLRCGIVWINIPDANPSAGVLGQL